MCEVRREETGPLLGGGDHRRVLVGGRGPDRCLQNGWRLVRKQRRCCACFRWSERGEILQYWVAVQDGEFRFGYFCVQCSETYHEKPMHMPPERYFF